MTTTPKYEFDKTDYGTTGWNDILKGFTEDVDDFLQTYLVVTLGEAVSAYKPVYMSTDGKYYLAKASAGKVPCLGITIEAGSSDEQVRIQRIGEITISTAAFTIGAAQWVNIDGTFTETRPNTFAQRIGQAMTATKLLIYIEPPSPVHYGYAAPPNPPTSYPDGIVYFQLATTTTVTTTTVTGTSTTTTTTTV